MKEFKGTKGEWHYTITKKRQIAVIIPERYGERVIENKVYLGVIGEDYCSNPKCCNVEAHANAHLIAAAPNLLSVCLTLYQVLEHLINNPVHETVMADLTAAINKAIPND